MRHGPCFSIATTTKFLNLDQDNYIMSDVNKALSLLFNEVDEWFSHEAFHAPLSRITLDEDRARLAVIGRTTGKWFKLLIDPMTSIELEDDITGGEFNLDGFNDFDSPRKLSGTKSRPNNVNLTTTAYDHNSNNKNKICSIGGGRKRKLVTKPPAQRRLKKSSISEKESLDSLVRDLEFLLEKDEREEKNEETFYVHKSYSDDELAMLDDSIGYCCTIAREKFTQTKKEWSSLSVEDIRDRHQTSLDEPPDRFQLMEGDSEKRNSNEQQSNDLIIQTVMPLDHDYLPRPQTKPLLLSNKLLQQGTKNRQRIVKRTINPKSSSSSVINTEALKRLAPFSDQIRLLSNKYSRIFSVESD